ncbi:hypothetical protein HELRODRAFT_182533 [Helobdella robusta]|uniref:Uncharacterized protein n=1 Tax=Helobdella robusta TaxID=6412 RepID=T1FIB6_HELRO|nr:hypothetical protein HELRODRAFT_182533 [Helobdella robusta]ESN90824.1 hypothetical protein HELRODRAFT_182533 [Helobdella robusta]
MELKKHYIAPAECTSLQHTQQHLYSAPHPTNHHLLNHHHQPQQQAITYNNNNITNELPQNFYYLPAPAVHSGTYNNSNINVSVNAPPPPAYEEDYQWKNLVSPSESIVLVKSEPNDHQNLASSSQQSYNNIQDDEKINEHSNYGINHWYKMNK